MHKVYTVSVHCARMGSASGRWHPLGHATQAGEAPPASITARPHRGGGTCPPTGTGRAALSRGDHDSRLDRLRPVRQVAGGHQGDLSAAHPRRGGDCCQAVGDHRQRSGGTRGPDLERHTARCGVRPGRWDRPDPADVTALRDLLTRAGITPPRLTSALPPEVARRIADLVAAARATPAAYGPRRSLSSSCARPRQAAPPSPRSPAASARSGVRPDGYIAHAVSGEAIQRAGRLHSGPDGLRAGTYEVGRFYYSDGGVFYEVGPTSNAPTLRSASQRSSTGSGRSTRCSTASRTRRGR